jgi:hypothetical protein
MGASVDVAISAGRSVVDLLKASAVDRGQIDGGVR